MINAEAMNSVTEKKRLGSIFTKDIVAGIPVLVQQGLSAETIAARLGCTVGSLRVRCSQAQISLRIPKEVKVVPLVPAPKAPKQKRFYGFALPTTLQLSRVAMSRLRQHAEAIGVSEAQLASDLLEVIARDDLYDAVLDSAKEPTPLRAQPQFRKLTTRDHHDQTLLLDDRLHAGSNACRPGESGDQQTP